MTERPLYETTEALLAEGRATEALRILEPLADSGDPVAMAILGFMYFTGHGVEPNGLLAVRFLAEAAALGEGIAAHNLGTLYSCGMPEVSRSAAKAMRFYRRARELGCQLAVDAFYEKGLRDSPIE